MTEPTLPPITRPAPRLAAPTRILQAAARRIVDRGAAQLSMQEIAEAADVSKGLIHYHFHDKETLLTRVVEWMADGLADRESRALDGATPASAVEQLWSWLEGEMIRGHLRVLLELGQEPGDLLQRAIMETARRRRTSAAATVSALYSTLELRPRIPPVLMAEVVVAFADGLAIDVGARTDADRRVAFDVFWLAMLSLAE